MEQVKKIACCAFVAALAGCTHKVELGSAKVHTTDASALVEVPLSAHDVQVIRKRELYFWIVVVECADRSKRFPLQPFLDGKAIEGGNIPSTTAVTVYGKMPVSNFQRYRQPCAFLDGGGYFSGKLSSAVVPVSSK